MAAKRSLDMQGRNLDLFRVTAASKLDTDGSEIGLTFSFPVPSGQEQQHVSSIKLKQDNENKLTCWFANPAPPVSASDASAAGDDGVLDKADLRMVVSRLYCCPSTRSVMCLCPVFTVARARDL